MPLHIIHIIPTLRFGGAERFVVDLANHSDPAKFRHTIITLFHDTPLAEEIERGRAAVLTVPKKGKVSLDLFSALERELKRLKSDIAHTHLSGGDIWGRVAAKRIGLPVLTTLHNINNDEGVMLRLVQRVLSRKSDMYVACSNAVKAFAEKAYGIPESRANVIRYGIPLNRFSGIAPLPSELPRPARLLFIGRLVPQKGIDVAISALADVDPSLWRLSIAGDGPLRSSLETRAKKHRIMGNISFAGGTHDVPELLRSHDVLLVPSRWEGLGIVMMEAMAAGRLVIASRTGGIPELVRDGETGMLLPVGDTKAWAQRIASLPSRWDKWRRMAAAGQAYAREHCGIERMVHRYEEVYEKFIHDKYIVEN